MLKIEGWVWCGCLVFECGVVEILVFMFVGIYGIVKGMIFEELKDSGVYICFGNMFYLMFCFGIGIIC